MGLLLLTGQFEGTATGIPAKTRDAKKTRKTGHYTNEKRLGGSFFPETKRVAATQKNSFAQRVCF
jgi:hypothetical protein